MRERQARALSIPRELAEFFSRPGGKSLIIKGLAGTGKTTLALQILEEIADPETSFYLSTRVSDASLYIQFPWLREKDMKTRIVDASREFLATIYHDEESRVQREKEVKIKGAKEFLRSLQGPRDEAPEAVDRTCLSKLLDRYTLPEIVRVYDRVETRLPKKSFFVIDSVEGLTTRYSLQPEELIHALQKDLVEHSNVNMLVILEKGTSASIDYLADGVVTLGMTEMDGRRIREIRVEKLRATEISRPRYLVSLRNGRFRAFEPFRAHGEPRGWVPVPDTPTHYSTGTPDLDALLGGGFRRGSYNVIEVAENVSTEEYYSLIRPILLNFIGHSRGAIVVLPGGDQADTLRDDLTRYMDSSLFDRWVQIADYFIQETKKPYIMALGTRNKEEALRNWRTVLQNLRGPENQPIMDFAAFDTLEYLRGNDIAIRDLFNTVGRIKISSDVGVGLLKPGLKLTQEIMNMADTYLKIIDIDGSVCVFGINPRTNVFVITPDEEKGPPHMRLSPVV
ncbi:MAG: gas vesicle protein GvpD P-loop domain-containing protein [Thermoplasmatota archaeon]